MTSSTFLMTCAAALSQKLSYNKGRSGFGFGFGFGYRSPVIVSRPIISRPFAPFVQPRPFRGFGPARTGVAFGRIGRR